ncbi:MAG: GNAT family N-acetyltransferase [Chloroflexi bacterium]|nr:GNAT family N-acetyltransferase [Chloroflexota bacterium]
MAELVATVALQKAVWGMEDVEVASPHTLRAIAHSGGAVFGAQADGRLIGFCFGFAAPRADELWLWSHMAGVHPKYQGQGIGYRLKQAQRNWALAQGYRWMAWTFDPLQSGNANFNFNRLGVIAGNYSVDHYGEMQDGINAGLASDRLEAQWQLDSPAAIGLAERGCCQIGQDLPDAIQMAVLEKGGALQYRQPRMAKGTVYGLEIPLDIAALKARDIEKAKQWQLYVRAAMTELLAAGYVVSAFVREGDRAWYVLSPAG